MDAGDVLVESVQVVTQLVANVTLDVGRESSYVVLPQTNTGHILGQGYGHSILVILWKSKVFPEENKIPITTIQQQDIIQTQKRT